MTADPLGGVWPYALDLAGAMAAYGIEYLLVTMGGTLSESQRSAANAHSNIHLVETPFRLEWMDHPWEEVDAAGDFLLAQAEHFAPDLVHLNGYVHAALPWECPVLVVAHSCVLSWWQAVHGEPAPAKYQEYSARVRRGLQAAATVVAPSTQMLSSLREHYGCEGKGRVIHNGRTLVPTRFAVPKEPFVLAAGRLWDPAKNFSLLDQVAGQLPWKVIAAGDCQHPNSSPVALPHLDCLGVLSAPDLASYYRRASIYALPVRYEPFGLSILEAAINGCALILGDQPSMRELWHQSAFYVPPDDPQVLRETLHSLIDSPKLRTEMGARARIQGFRYTAEAMSRAYHSLYQEMLQAASQALTASSQKEAF